MEILEAIVKLAVPVALGTVLLFYRLYNSGRLDRNASHKAIRSSLKKMKKAAKTDADRQTEGRIHNLLESRWMKFGGGFYGVAALWTFVVIEMSDAYSLIFNFPGFASLFENGLVSLVVHALVNQFTNFVAAFVWFSYWGDKGANPLVWLVVAYLGYLLGVAVARVLARLSEASSE